MNWCKWVRWCAETASLSGAVAIAAGLMLGACAQGGDRPSARDGAAPAPPADRLGAVGPQKLAAGQCGLFLWSRTTPPRLVLFSDGAAGTAQMVIDGRAQILRRDSGEGEGFYGQFPKQHFAAGGFSLHLSLEGDADAGIVNGAKISRGLLRLEDETGGYQAVPVAGMIACEAP